MFENKKIFILGMARSGYEAAKLLSKYNNKIVINDANEKQDENHLKELKNLGVSIVLGEHPDEIFDKSFDYLIKNPGIRDTHKYVEYARKHNIKVINEIEMAYHFLPKNVKLIGITGTNGKTTTTTLIYEIIKKAYDNVHFAGNMGFPLSAFIGKIKENDILVMEISIQQLTNFEDFKTNISVLTNLSEAHIDHVGSYENYINIKKRIFNHHTKSDIAIINIEDKDSMCITENINSTKLYFSSKKSNTDAYIKDNSIFYKDEKIIDNKNIKLVGIHNYENIMCAISVAKQLNIENKYINEVLETFTGVEHRLEFVKRIKKRDFYNDSKATNNKSTMIALSAFTRPTILLMGGLDRGQSFDELKTYMENVKEIISYGETKNRINDFCIVNNIKCTVVNNLEEATNLAYNLSSEEDIILLSPACASWDQYKRFEDRGDEFKKVIDEIERNEEND
ncbi:MAG: UDP-N-acetylmuramoyl-L-alanine--D-glutamate ligase [Bacilli bacterium]|nr:UDP-N-acetylmuramoyl-L-alanine--D-glutamate ligase [Bacilli bacterium]